jgi:Bacterial Ig domain
MNTRTAQSRTARDFVKSLPISMSLLQKLCQAKSSPRPRRLGQPKRTLRLRFEQLEDRVVLADVGDTLVTALSTGLTGLGAFAHIERVGDGSFTTKDVDLYRLSAVVGSRLTVLTNPAPFVGAAMNTYVRVFDALGTQLAANNDFNGIYSRLTLTLRELGTYFVGISGNPNTAYNPNVGDSGAVGSTGDYSLAIQVEAPIAWTPEGPGTIRSGQVEGLASQSNPVAGAIQAVAPHPTDPNILYAASPNGGVWKTTSATASSPTWTPLTDTLPALSIYSLEFDPTDATANTILAGTGISSSFGSSGNLIGVYKSVDGGSTWTTFSNANGLPGTTDSVRGIAARGSTIVVAMRTNGVYQSTNGGASFTKISGLAGSNLPLAGAYDLASDPGNQNRLYVVTTSGVFRSDNAGLNWTNVTPAGSGLTTSTSNAKLTVHNNAGGGTNAVYVGVVNGGILSNVFRSDTQGAIWTPMGIPATPDALGRVIAAATNASPIVITTNNHGLATGQQVLISSARGNTAANGIWTVTVVDANRFSLNGSTGNGTYVANSGVWTRAFPITDATDASPIVITTAAAHGLANGNVVTIAGVNGNTAANGFWSISVINATTFSLNSSAGNGAYTSGGVWSRATTLQPNQGSIFDPEEPMRPQGFPAPPVPEGEEQPGSQGSIHFSLVADPNNSNLVYIAGDRQDTPFPNAIGAQNFTGRLFRGDVTQPAGNRWTPMTHNFADADGVGVGAPGTAPHADSRDMAFDANGNLVEADDGGVYRRSSPQSSTGVWNAVIGNLAVTESHSASYDPVTQRFISGHQDTGTAFQSAIGSSTWDQVAQADGGVTQVAVEGVNSVQYFSFQNHGSWRRRTLNAAGTQIGVNTLQGRVTIGGTNVTVFSMPDDTLQFYGPYRINPTNPARMALGSDNYIYESFNRGDDFVRVPSPAINPDSEFIRSVAYGHPGNPDVIYAGGNVAATELMVRTTAGGSLVNIGGTFPGFFTAGLAIDPDDWQTLYVLDFNGRLWRTTDAGATVGNWTELTGNVTPLLGNRRSISVLDGGASDILLVGGVNGVFAMNTTTPGVWYEVGHNLPNAPAQDVRGYSGSNLISLATLGRGVWSVSSTNTAFDSTAPGLPTITRVDPSPTTAASVSFQLTFPEPVAGVSLSNLALATTGVSGAWIAGITGGGTTWNVAVGTGTGNGTIGLDWAGAGAVTDVAGNPLAAGTVTGPTYQAAVTDTVAPRVISTSVVPNAVLAPSALTYIVTFSEPINQTGFTNSAFSLRGVSRNVTLTPTTVVWTAANMVLTLTYSTLSDDNYTLILNSGTSGATFRDAANNALDGEITGALPSGNGTAGGNAVLPFSVDIDSELLGPLLRNDPPGSLIYDPSLSRVIAFAGDNDDFTFAVDPGQKITVVVTPSTQVPNTLRPSVTVKDPSSAILATHTAPAAAQKALLQSISTTAGGIYTISVTGAASSMGLYTVQLILNASAEVESNNTLATAQDIDDSFLTFATADASAQRGAVMGTTDAGSYLVSTPSFSFTDISTTGTIRFNNGVNNSTIGIGLGWNFNLFGIDYPTMFFSDNGLATFITSTSSGANATLSANPTQAAIAPFWDDLLVSNSAANASVRTQSFGATPNRQFVIQWDKVTFASGGNSSDPITFQLILNEANSSFQFNYLDLVSGSAPGNNGGGATVGAKTVNPTNGKFIELSSNNASSPYLGAGKSILFAPIADTADYYAFDLVAGQSATFAVTGQLPGNLQLELRRTATDPPPVEEILATGDASATNATKIITSYTAPADGTFYARISGDGNIPYSLVVTRNAAFDAEPNNTPATAQDLTGQQGVFGDLEMTTLTVSDSGWWDNTGFHDTTNKNYIATATSAMNRDFFVLDLSGITQTITGAALRLQNPTTGVGGTPTFTLFDVSTPIATLQASNSGQLGIYNDLGTGTQYGSRTFAATDNATLSSVVFNAAGIAALNAARGSQLAVGGAITSAGGFVFSSTGSGNIRQLVLAFAPEDWYSVDVSAASPNIRLETRTPADGSFQFVNNLNPRIELYDPSGVLVTHPAAHFTVLADGRNESIAYHAPGLTPGTYRVRVTAEAGSPGGEYFLSAITLPNVVPVAVNEVATTNEDTAVVIDVLANDTDPDGALDPATVTIKVGPAHGSVTIHPATGQITYTPGLNYNGTDSFTYTVQDDTGALSNAAMVNVAIASVNDVTDFDVQRGALQRSFIRYLDLVFENSDDLDEILAQNRVQLTRYGLDGVSSPTLLNLAGVVSRSGNSLNFNFGAAGIGGNRNSNVGDGYYVLAVDMDGDGTFESTRRFYRLFGDANGDREVSAADADLILAAYGTTGLNLNGDINGDGVVNALDRTYAIRAIGRKLLNGLWVND